jgi:tRNA-dihydrouridine synthase
MRKHLDWYCRGFEGAPSLRAKLMHVNNALDVEALLAPYLTGGA